jgi:hypothetical protein
MDNTEYLEAYLQWREENAFVDHDTPGAFAEVIRQRELNEKLIAISVAVNNRAVYWSGAFEIDAGDAEAFLLEIHNSIEELVDISKQLDG